MKQFLTLDDLSNFDAQVQLAKDIKANPYQFEEIGKRKTLGLLFFNPSLRTRLSTQKAGRLLGMDVMVMNFSNEAWAY
jgi:N-succinyl-L-ornithine transcarbamylase